MGSTISYLERYTLLALTGLAAHDQDNDGKGSGGDPEYISKKQLSAILDMINEKEVDESRFCKWAKVEKLEAILSKDFKKVVAALKAKKKPERQPGDE
jgi:hypothetical protein